MIGPDLVRARRRGDVLHLTELRTTERMRALEIGEELLLAAKAHLDAPQEEVESALSAIDRSAKEEKLWAGLKKLVLDHCRFDAPLEVEPERLRRHLFTRASAERQKLEPGTPLDRQAVIEATAKELEITSAVLEQGLFGDLKSAQKLIEEPRLSAEQLVELYETAQLQGVLLRAVRLSLVVRESSAEAYRALFHKLKFRQLLYQIHPLEDGRYRIDIDGPFSLFESVTKYGLQLALLVPVLKQCQEVELSSTLRWGKERRELSFQKKLRGAGEEQQSGGWLRPDVDDLLVGINRAKGPWEASVAGRLLDLPGIGVIVPDLVLEAPGKPKVFVEVLGFWSRDAVWRRVEWAESRAKDASVSQPPVLFAVSKRLRVSESVLPEAAGAALYVYKGVMSVRAVMDRASRLVDMARPPKKG